MGRTALVAVLGLLIYLLAWALGIGFVIGVVVLFLHLFGVL